MTGNDEFIDLFLANLQKSFATGKEEIKCFKHLGLSIDIETNRTLDQKHYIDPTIKNFYGYASKRDLISVLT